MKKAGCFCLALLIFCICVMPAYAAPEDTGADLSVSSGCNTYDASVPFLGSAPLITNAEAVFLYEINTQTLMYSWNADVSMHPASLVKILTALIAIEKGSLSDQVTATDSALSTVPYDAVSAELQDGEIMGLDDLLYCMMVGSANDAAAVIADHISGSQSAFVEEMNSYAQALGCTGTNFVNVHGIHDDAQVTTARDVAKILGAALNNEVFREIYSTVYYTIPATNLSKERKLSSGNYLMNNQDSMQIYYDARVTGGRTGVAENGGRCLAITAKSGNLEFISVIMGSKSVYEEDGYTVRSFGGFHETTQLLNFGFDGYKAVQILSENQILKQYPVTNGKNRVTAGTISASYAVLPEDATVADLTFTYTDLGGELTAPVKAGQQLSTVSVWYRNNCIAQVGVYAMNSVAENTAGVSQNIEPTPKNPLYTVIAVVVIILVILGGIFIGLRVIKKVRLASARNRSRRYRRNRRRNR